MLMGIILLASCKGTPEVPTQFETLDVKATIFPDYTDIVIPANIAPLNFMVKDTLCTAVVANFKGKVTTWLLAAMAQKEKLLSTV